MFSLFLVNQFYKVPIKFPLSLKILLLSVLFVANNTQGFQINNILVLYMPKIQSKMMYKLI